MHRFLFLLGSTALLLTGCHGNGAPGDMGQDPGTMMYRPTPALHRRAVSCPAPVAPQATRASCDRTPTP